MGQVKRYLRGLSGAYLGWAVVILCLVLPRASYSQKNELLERILTQNATVRKRLQSLYYKIQYRFERWDPVDPDAVDKTREGPCRGEGHGEVWEKGSRRATVNVTVRTWVNSGVEQTRQARSILTDKYFAFWLEGTVNAHQYDHESLARMTPRVAEIMVGYAVRDYLAYSMSTISGRSLKDYYLETRQVQDWTVEEESEGSKHLFHIKVFEGKAEPNTSPMLSYWIDPDRGYLITRSAMYYPDGVVSDRDEIQVQKIGSEDLWMPVVIRTTEFRRASPESELVLLGKRETRLTDIRPNIPIEDTRFTVDALGVPEGTYLFRNTTDGQVLAYIFWNRAFIPVERKRELDRIKQLVDLETLIQSN